MKLVVAEKPSVAQSLAAVLGAKEKKDGYLEGGGWLVSWCVGHLVELAQPEAYGFYVGQRWSSGCTLLVHNIDHSSFLFPTNINHYILLIIISGISFIYI